MSNIHSLSIVDAGIICPLGNNIELVVSSVNAGVSVLGESHVYGKQCSPFRMAIIPNGAAPELNS